MKTLSFQSFFVKNSITFWYQDLHVLSDKPSHL